MLNYNTYGNNMYLQDLQNMRDRIDRTMQQYQHQQMQPQTQPPITQNFQLAPTQLNTDLEAKYATNIDDVRNTFVIKTGIFATKDFSTIWVKDVTGDIKTYKTEEVIELDARDKQIADLQAQIKELKGAMLNATYDNTNVDDATSTKKSTRVPNNPKPNG